MTNNTVPVPDPGSFRDPSGSVFWDNGKLKRQVNLCYKEQYDLLMSSGLYDELTRQGLLVAHRETDGQGAGGQAYKVLEPELMPLISYPYEWCFGQYKDAALTTLRIHRTALNHDMILKDASAYNVQFIRGHAIHIDTLSFDSYTAGEPWVAYGQFCRHFLAPLFLMVHSDIRLSQLMRIYIDGVPLDLASKLLSGKGGISAKTHIHWHAKSVMRHGQAGRNEQTQTRRMSISKFQMTAMIDSLIKTVEKLQLRGIQTEWGDYYADTNYSDAASGSKRAAVADYLAKVTPEITWDFGANDGTYSRLALSDAEKFVAAFDIDPIAVERNHTRVRQTNENMLPLLLDLTNPSPAIGFANLERGALTTRQRPDCIIMLALIHHLAISNNLPLGMIAGWLASLCRHLIIEFVPKTDSQVGILLATRDDIFPDYTEEGFEKAFKEWFEIKERRELAESSRSVYLMSRKNT